MDNENPQHWSLETCANKLMESEKAEEINGLIWNLRGTVFHKLQEMGKFDDTVEGSDAQVCVDMVIGRLMGAI